MLKLYGRETSSNTQKVLWLLAELGLERSWIKAGGSYGTMDAAMNPNRLVPVIDDDGFILWESNAILRYLCDTHAPDTPFYPRNPKRRAEIDRWMEWLNAHFHRGIQPLLAQHFRGGGRAADPARFDDRMAATLKCMTILNDWLAERSFLAGEELTLAEMTNGIWAHRWYLYEADDKPDFPHFRAWYDRMMERPGYREFVAVGP